jgi:hypothetical protein
MTLPNRPHTYLEAIIPKTAFLVQAYGPLCDKEHPNAEQWLTLSVEMRGTRISMLKLRDHHLALLAGLFAISHHGIEEYFFCLQSHPSAHPIHLSLRHTHNDEKYALLCRGMRWLSAHLSQWESLEPIVW